MSDCRLEEEKYLNDFEFLAEEIELRRNKQSKIREKINDFAERHFGIKNYSALMNAELGESSELKISVCCQVPTANIEHAAAQVFAEWLSESGLPAKTVFTSFVSDSFAYANDYKKSLIRIMWLKRRKKTGELYVEGEKILPKKSGDIGGMILSEIKTKDGDSLPEYHQGIMEAVFPKPYELVDSSKLFEDCLRQSFFNGGRTPDYFYEVDGEREKKLPIQAGLNGQKVRPPASWFYFLHLLAFLDGERALVTQINDCRKIEKCFNDSIELIKREIGFEPLIIYTPELVTVDGYTSNLYEINGALSGLDKNRSFKPKSRNLFSAMREIEEELIAFG